MSRSNDARSPARWKAGAAPIEGLSEAVVALSASHASDAELSRLRAALAPQLAAPTRSASTSTFSWLSGSRVWPWLSVLAIGLTGLWALAAHEPRPAQQRPAHAATIVAPKASTHAVTLLPSPTPSAAPPSPVPLTTPRNTNKRKAPVTVEAPNPLLTPEAELVLLRQAQSALNRSASAALALADEHALHYPNGLFVQEREMLRIEAELTLGKRTEALMRAHEFSVRFGRSTYRARIDRLLESHRALKDKEASAPASTQ